jgi:hypothetical protein
VQLRRGIRWHLFQVQLVSIVPIGLFAAAMLYLHWQAQENERERSQMESVRLIAAAATTRSTARSNVCRSSRDSGHRPT